MAKLMKINEWISNTFSTESAPHYNTVLNWVKTNKVPHKTIGSTIYIEVETKSPDIMETVNRIAAKF